MLESNVFKFDLSAVTSELNLKALNILDENLGDQRFFFQFEIIMAVLVSSFRFI